MQYKLKIKYEKQKWNTKWVRESYRENNNSADRDSDKKHLLVMVAAFPELPIGRHLSILLIWSQIFKNLGWSLGLCSPVIYNIEYITPYMYLREREREILRYRSLLTDEDSELIRHYLVAKCEHFGRKFSNYHGDLSVFCFLRQDKK